ncbi:hypothetical protein FAM09_01615 [Niastella caeni]|uniref:DUF3575 domain-containing protein n=1 Tax=Niastella caeni TaxID=2569763 RepID=A0A4S8HYF2_9BACT|nr:hypothetical protein [Niastella caeni]THU40838.1 hypothetical protein FAM09_01615 [Niastella caeni]
MLRCSLYCLLLLLVAVNGIGQFKNARYKNARYRELYKKVPVMQRDTGTLYLRHNPLGLIDFMDGNITFGAEYRFNEIWAATMDAGAILYSAYFPRNRQATGVLLRPGVRIYPGKYKDVFVDLQFHYKQVTYRVRDWLEKDVVNGVASYEEFKTFRYRKQVMGVNMMAGVKEKLFRSDRFFIELYLGVGVHFKNEYLYNEPNSRYDPPFTFGANRGTTNSSDNTSDGKSVLPALPGGIRLVWRLR